MTHNGTNRSLERTAAILDILEEGCLSLSEISRRTSISTSSVHRLMGSLVDLGFVRRDDKGKFRLGRRFGNDKPESVIRESLSQIRDETGASSQFWVKRQHTRLCIAAAYSEADLEPNVAEGLKIPLANGGSAGKILSSTPDAIDSIRSRGWVESHNARLPNAASLSVPLIVNGKMYGAICAVVPPSQHNHGIGEEYGRALASMLRDCAPNSQHLHSTLRRRLCCLFRLFGDLVRGQQQWPCRKHAGNAKQSVHRLRQKR